MISLVIGILVTIVLGAILFWVIDRFSPDARFDGAIHLGELFAASSSKEIWGMSVDPNQRDLLLRVVIKW